MTTSFKLFSVFFLAFFFVTEKGNNKQDLQDVNGEGKCVIDTVGILKNKNLTQLVKQLENTKLTTYNTTKSIPPLILNFLKCAQGGKFSIANPGEDWQATDVIIGDLPDRQLIFFATTDSIAMMAHFTGGIGKSEHILIFAFNNSEIIEFWCGNILANLTDTHEVLDFIKKNKNKKGGLNTNIIYF